MSGYETLLKLRRLEEQADKLGFRLGHSKHQYSNNYGDLVSLFPKDLDALPIYNRDAEIFTGTFEQMEVWFRGVEWARSYDMMLRVSDEKKRERKEQDQRNRNILAAIKAAGKQQEETV